LGKRFPLLNKVLISNNTNYFDAVKKKAAGITPVPGGVGPLTVAMLLSQTVTAAEMSLERQRS